MNPGKSLKDQVAERIGKSGLRLPMLGAIALELQQALRDDDMPAARIEQLIAKDPALAGQVLRMANSSAYAGLSQISTIRQALLRLGTGPVARLAIAASQMSLYQSRSPLVAAHMSALWRHAYASAVGASWVAEKTGRPDFTEAAFLAGLLHDIGKLVILRALAEIATDGPAPSGALVREMLGSLHAEFGYALMKQWNLPEAYCAVARDHEGEGFDASQPLLAMVRLLDQVCAKLGIGGDADPEMVPAASMEAQSLGLSEVQLAELEIVLEDTVAPA